MNHNLQSFYLGEKIWWSDHNYEMQENKNTHSSSIMDMYMSHNNVK